MHYVSLFSGIEAATVAWHPLGWEPVAFSEIEPFPSAVLAHHYPTVPNLGDMTKVDWSAYAGVDLVCGGSPCQAFSVAGLRRGLADPRGNLALEYLRAVDAMRPRWVVWENVPGVLSSGAGRDFGAILGALGQLGYGWAYRVLDAQHVRTQSHPRAVPQRRRRVWLVGCLGDWRCAAAVLLERESMFWHRPPRREAGQGAAHTLTGGSGNRGWSSSVDGVGTHFIPEVSNALCSNDYKGSKADKGLGAPLIPEVARGYAVRRLTPRECERLQGFPDDYTRIPWRTYQEAARKGVSYESLLNERGMRLREPTTEHCPDGPRYKALGNSWAVNEAAWIGQRIQAFDLTRYAR